MHRPARRRAAVLRRCMPTRHARSCHRALPGTSNPARHPGSPTRMPPLRATMALTARNEGRPVAGAVEGVAKGCWGGRCSRETPPNSVTTTRPTRSPQARRLGPHQSGVVERRYHPDRRLRSATPMGQPLAHLASLQHLWTPPALQEHFQCDGSRGRLLPSIRPTRAARSLLALMKSADRHPIKPTS